MTWTLIIWGILLNLCLLKGLYYQDHYLLLASITWAILFHAERTRRDK